jgi:hypothetical protein
MLPKFGQVPVNVVLVDVESAKNHLSGFATLPANRCPFSRRRELARFDKDFGEAVGEAIEANANSVV